MVTIARIVLLPVPCAFLIYGGSVGTWVAFTLYTLLGATDFVDGAMARREGPTKFGGLIDPVADKIFVASICLALVAISVMPVWALMAVLSRELFITALRTSVAFREESIRTSRLAKMKTIVQMGGFGTIFLTMSLSAFYAGLLGTLLCLGLLAFSLIYWLMKRKKPPFWALPVAGTFLYWTLLSVYLTPEQSVLSQLIVIVAITWISCFDYVVSTYKMFLRTGIGSRDWVRLFWAASHTLLAAPLVAYYPSLVLPLLISMSFELALGGVDMVVASDQKYAGVSPFFATSTVATIVSLLCYANYLNWISVDIIALSVILAFVSIAAFAATYAKWQFLFRNVLGMD